MRRFHVESCFPCLAHTFHAKSSPLLGFHVDVHMLHAKGIFVLQYTLDVLGLHWAQRSLIVTLTSNILLLAQIQAQKPMLLGPNTWSNYFMLLGLYMAHEILNNLIQYI